MHKILYLRDRNILITQGQLRLREQGIKLQKMHYSVRYSHSKSSKDGRWIKKRFNWKCMHV